MKKTASRPFLGWGCLKYCAVVALVMVLIFPLRIDLKGVLTVVFGGLLELTEVQ
jgi:hypothetical protein